MIETTRFRNLLFRCRYGFRGYPKAIRGIPFRLDESLRRIATDGEDAIQQTIEAYLKPGGSFADIGANYGLHTLLASHLIGKDGRVVAVEPVPENLRLLRRNLRLNGFESRCKVVPKALTADGVGEVEMTIEPGLSCAASLAENFTGAKIRVPSGTLDECLAAGGFRPDLIKIDVEGAEHEVLKGATESLKQGVPLLIEVHTFALPAFGSSPEILRAYLGEFGYGENRLSEMESHLGSYFHALYTV